MKRGKEMESNHLLVGSKYEMIAVMITVNIY